MSKKSEKAPLMPAVQAAEEITEFLELLISLTREELDQRLINDPANAGLDPGVIKKRGDDLEKIFKNNNYNISEIAQTLELMMLTRFHFVSGGFSKIPIEKQKILINEAETVTAGFKLIQEDAARKVKELEQQLAESEQLRQKAEQELEKLNKELAKKGGLIKMGVFGVKQFYKPGKGKQLKAWSDQELTDFMAISGTPALKNKIDSFGLDLNQAEFRMFEGIMKRFSETKYQGDSQISKSELPADINVNIAAWENIITVPVIKVTQAELLSLAEYGHPKWKSEGITAVNSLATKQYYFYWSRLAKDKKGNPEKDKAGNYVMQDVMEVSTLFRITTIFKPDTAVVDYYEIQPSSVLLDQVTSNYGGNHFLLIPYGWRQEVKLLTGKNPSRYTSAFLLWLRLRFEEIRSSKYGAKNYQIKMTWEEIAEILKMPPTMLNRQRKRAEQLIKDAYAVAIKLGYLINVEPHPETDTLFLNESFYPSPKEKEKEIEKEPAKKIGV